MVEAVSGYCHHPPNPEASGRDKLRRGEAGVTPSPPAEATPTDGKGGPKVTQT